MEVFIQAGNPRTTGEFDPEDQSLGEAVETCFAVNTETALLSWSSTLVPLDYKYCLSTLLEDILLMLNTLIDNDQGRFENHWPSNDFRSQWVMRWRDDELTITAKWEAVVGNTEAILNRTGPLNLSKLEFVREWKAVLERIIDGLDTCGYDVHAITAIADLKATHQRIDDYGVLYRQ